MLNKPPKPNPALDRIRQIKSRSGSGLGSTFDSIDEFTNPIIQATEKPDEALPALEDETNMERLAMRLAALQAEGLGTIAPTRTDVYNNTGGQVDLLITTLENMKPQT